MKVKREDIQPDADSSFKLLLTPKLNDLFYWHFHAEYEIVYVEAPRGIRHIGDHISSYDNSDLALIGPNIPHLNFDYGVKNTVNTVVVQMKEGFLGTIFLGLPEMAAISQLFERAKKGIAFHGKTKEQAGERLKKLPGLSHFDRLIVLLEVLQLLATTGEYEVLNGRPVGNVSVFRGQQRMQQIHHFIETHYQRPIELGELSRLTHLSEAAFCRYFKKSTQLTFTAFLNQYRINQAKKILLQHKTVTEACFESGFENLSHFNKTFKRMVGENPSTYRKRQELR